MNEKELTFQISRKVLLNANVSYHYRDKGNRAKKLRELAREQCEELDWKFNHFEVVVYVFPPTRRRMDPPNLYPTVKHLIDGLTDAELWEDDDWTHLSSMTFKYGGLSEIKDHFLIKLVIKEV